MAFGDSCGPVNIHGRGTFDMPTQNTIELQDFIPLGCVTYAVTSGELDFNYKI